jgi:hypothetical protein
MSQSSKKEYLRNIYPRYQMADAWEKRRILDELCANCGYHRKRAIRLLNGPPPGEARHGDSLPAVVDAGKTKSLLARRQECLRHLISRSVTAEGRLSGRVSFVALGSDPSPVRRQLKKTLSTDTLSPRERAVCSGGCGWPRAQKTMLAPAFVARASRPRLGRLAPCLRGFRRL